MKNFPDKKIFPTRFEGYYVGKNGTIWTHWTSDGYVGKVRRMNQFPRGGIDPNDRYLSINISLKDENGKTQRQINYYSHKLIAETLIPNPDQCAEVNHKNRNKLDNRIENIEWSTRAENMSHLKETYNDIVKREKPFIEEYEPIIDYVPPHWKMNYKPEKIILPPPPKFKIVDVLNDKEYQVRNIHNWVNSNWSYLSTRCRTKKVQNFYGGLMVAKNKNKQYSGFKVMNI